MKLFKNNKFLLINHHYFLRGWKDVVNSIKIKFNCFTKKSSQNLSEASKIVSLKEFLLWLISPSFSVSIIDFEFRSGIDCSIHIWGLTNLTLVSKLENAHDKAICSLAVSGNHLFSGSLNTIKVWSINPGSNQSEYNGTLSC